MSFPTVWFHGSPACSVETMADFRGRFIFVTDSPVVARQYCRPLLGSAAGSDGDGEPGVYRLQAFFGAEDVFDTRRPDHLDLFLRLVNETRGSDDPLVKRDLVRVPAAPGSRVWGEFPTYGVALRLLDLVVELGFVGAFVGEGTQGASLMVADPQDRFEIVGIQLVAV